MYKRQIQYSFTGEELLLFGAILYPGQRLPDDRADIVVVLKGPVRPVVLREKQRIAGMWVNASSIRLRTSPGFYAIGSSRPVDKLVDERTAAIFELGLKNLSMSPTGFSEAKKLERFEAGLVDLYRRMGLFYENPSAVEITEGVLYRARIPVPARVPVGTYRAETYLISKGRVLAVASVSYTHLDVYKRQPQNRERGISRPRPRAQRLVAAAPSGCSGNYRGCRHRHGSICGTATGGRWRATGNWAVRRRASASRTRSPATERCASMGGRPRPCVVPNRANWRSDWHLPVSYTHLDVYKRQPSSEARRLRMATPCGR